MFSLLFFIEKRTEATFPNYPCECPVCVFNYLCSKKKNFFFSKENCEVQLTRDHKIFFAPW